ncbi:peptidase [candidate division MSBL1 archaeon SCGC-AAA261D19]|uniref:Peptidase n=1 Tax=candidate division MSBL1 archaeon SCGC-AAA261D19 TaxID=1698273 RepID=A0A133V853_9EURY|nr:peptidase [candidate division MSBL1 archaeon SCGC-AAA261D19]
MKGLIISADGFEDEELTYPYRRLQEEGIEIVLAAPSSGEIRGKHGYSVTVDRKLDEIDPRNFDFLVLPGGKAPQELRKNQKVLEISKHFFREDKPVAAICHGPQVLISADLLKNKTATCYRGVKKELLKVGADYRDEEVVVDGNLITSREPPDLPAFMRELLKKIKG